MRKLLPCVFLLVALCLPAFSQEVVHALTGTVSSINSASKTLTVLQDSGGQGVFSETAGKARFLFDKKVAEESVNAASFSTQGAYAIVFYYGLLNNPTVVAVKALGKGPFKSTEGTVTGFSGHAHSISISDPSGAVENFKITDSTIAEGDMGAVEGVKMDAHKGDHVRIVSQMVDGAPTAVFIRD